MSQDIRGSLLWDDEPAFEDEDPSWDDDEEFDMTDEDCEVMESVGWEPDDLPSEKYLPANTHWPRLILATSVRSTDKGNSVDQESGLP